MTGAPVVAEPSAEGLGLSPIPGSDDGLGAAGAALDEAAGDSYSCPPDVDPCAVDDDAGRWLLPPHAARLNATATVDSFVNETIR